MPATVLRSTCTKKRDARMVQMPGMNTPQFDWARNKLDYAYQPVGDVFDPDVAADAVWRALREAPRELWVGGSAIEAMTGQLIAPALLDRYLARAACDRAPCYRASGSPCRRT